VQYCEIVLELPCRESFVDHYVLNCGGRNELGGRREAPTKATSRGFELDTEVLKYEERLMKDGAG